MKKEKISYDELIGLLDEYYDLDFVQYPIHIHLKRLHLVNLLLRTGYLTIDRSSQKIDEGEENLFKLKIPNHEVYKSFFGDFLSLFLEETDELEVSQLCRRFKKALCDADYQVVTNLFNTIITRTPYHWFSRREDDKKKFDEGTFAASISTFLFATFGESASSLAEQPTSHGRIDFLFYYKDQTLIFEFKVLGENEEPSGSAMKQIVEKRYFDPEVGKGRKIHLIGCEFYGYEKRVALLEHAVYDELEGEVGEIQGYRIDIKTF